MSDITEKDTLLDWCQELVNTHLPRWNELPDIELYMDQVITIIERYLAVFSADSHDKIITAAMINNYVKLGIIPKPEKKRYGRIHLAYLLVITILKQVITITEIKDGIFLQSRLHGEKQAYNDFCEAQEQAFLVATKLPFLSLLYILKLCFTNSSSDISFLGSDKATASLLC